MKIEPSTNQLQFCLEQLSAHGTLMSEEEVRHERARDRENRGPDERLGLTWCSISLMYPGGSDDNDCEQKLGIYVVIRRHVRAELPSGNAWCNSIGHGSNIKTIVGDYWCHLTGETHINRPTVDVKDCQSYSWAGSGSSTWTQHVLD